MHLVFRIRPIFYAYFLMLQMPLLFTTHLYEYISLTRRFVQNKIQKKHSKRQMILGKGGAEQRVFNRQNKIWKYSIKLCYLRNNLLYVPSLSSLIL